MHITLDAAMTIQLGVVMDDIATIKPYKDSSFAMLLAAQARGWTVWYMEMSDLFLKNGVAYARMCPVQVFDNKTAWFQLGEAEIRPLHQLQTILMRKDPPFNIEYVMATYLLEHAEKLGSLVVNKPQSLRDANEKLYTTWFPHCCVPTLVTCQMAQLREFLTIHQNIVVKPLDSMGGDSIFRVQLGDLNTSVIFETMTQHEQKYVMAQQFIPEITQGDKRILLINGQPIPYALARIPQAGELRGNLAAGGRGEGVALTARDHWICEQVGETLREKGLLFVGLDVIGDYLTEINVTSPTCIRELDQLFGLNIAGQLLDVIAEKLKITH